MLTISLSSVGQDKIVKMNGDTLNAKVLEIGTNAISFKKTNLQDGPVFTVMKNEIRLIVFYNGTIEYITSEAADKNQSPATSVKDSTKTQSNPKNHIEKKDGKYFVNDQKASSKEVDRLLSKSKNPAIIIPLKAAKATKLAQKIVKITSIPTTIGGGIGSLVSGIGLINDVRRGRDNTKTYVSFFTSMLTTISLPITNKILKSKSDKMYDKLIDAYNVTN